MWFSKDKNADLFKFKSLKTYSWDRGKSGIRKYRTVFERQELNYLSASLAFYNKKFDEENWTAKVTFIAFSLHEQERNKELCSEVMEIEVSKTENSIHTDFGWGDEQLGEYWAKGEYVWDVYVNDEFVASTQFTVEDVGRLNPSYNPYFDITSIKTYESSDELESAEERQFLQEFDTKHTRYVAVELQFINLVPTQWLCELFFNFYDDSGTLIGSAESRSIVAPTAEKEEFIITSGWGNNKGTTWLVDNYRVEIVFMDHVVAVITFTVGNKHVDLNDGQQVLLGEQILSFYQPDILDDYQVPLKPIDNLPQATESAEEDIVFETPNRPLKDVLKELNALIGLENIKHKILEYIDYKRYLDYRNKKGLEGDEQLNLHSVFIGNPGTGKTTVVKLLGEIYKAIGILSKGHVVSVESSDLISSYIRQTGETTKKMIEKARGGILFIDEAYMLFKEGSTNDFGSEAVAALITEMSDGPGDLAIIMAGYPIEMDKLLNSNPGLKSRFRNYFVFNDYTPKELLSIAEYAAEKRDVIIGEDAKIKLEAIITSAYRNRDRSFGNGRFAHSIIDEAKINLGVRMVRAFKLKNLTKADLLTIKAIDIEEPIASRTNEKLNLKIDQVLLKEALAELNSLIGLNNIKREVEELVKLTSYYKEINRDILKAFSMHSVFLGNPGTGKTTVARIIGKVYKALGLLERGHLVEADGGDLIAGFVGQTAIKTKDLIKKAMGGILFIDEAYAIAETSNQGGNDFGKKAIAALIKEMEDHRGEFALIVAGYTDNMNSFLETNPGIKSRFDRTFQFLDFTETELWEIAKTMLSKKGLIANSEAEMHIKKYIKQLYVNRDKFFGNARSIRKMIEKAYRNQELRMASLSSKERTKKIMATLALEDVLEFDSTKIEVHQKQRVGFK